MPPIKVLLRTRNKLLRQGKVDSTLAITKKVGKVIADVKSKLLSRTSHWVRRFETHFISGRILLSS